MAAVGNEAAPAKEGKLKIIHLVGSPVSKYYSMVSILYARQMLQGVENCEATKGAFEFHFAVVLPGGSWCFTRDLDEASIVAAPKLAHGEAISKIAAQDFDACVPHMFCYPGYTSYRALMDLLRIPLVGNSPECMGLITDKVQAKAVASAAGVPVPQGELLSSPSQVPTVPFPYVLKPCREDNSMGLAKVECEAELAPALAEAFKFDSSVVCERFIPLGREIRVGVFEDEKGEPTIVLPGLEYLLTQEHPMRVSADKISVTSEGVPWDDPSKFLSTNREDAPDYRRSICPCPMDEALTAKIRDAATKAHKALRCRDFSIFDFRVDPQGEVYMLECQPVCSFARQSPLMAMASKTDVPSLQHPTLYHAMMRRAAARRPKPYNADQILGMK